MNLKFIADIPSWILERYDVIGFRYPYIDEKFISPDFDCICIHDATSAEFGPRFIVVSKIPDIKWPDWFKAKWVCYDALSEKWYSSNEEPKPSGDHGWWLNKNANYEILENFVDISWLPDTNGKAMKFANPNATE